MQGSLGMHIHKTCAKWRTDTLQLTHIPQMLAVLYPIQMYNLENAHSPIGHGELTWVIKTIWSHFFLCEIEF